MIARRWPILIAGLACAAACATARATPGFVAVYRWTVKPGCESEFLSAWHAEAARYRDTYGSLGARIYREPDGTFMTTAYWPSRAAWARAPRPIDLPEAEAVLNKCVTSRLPAEELTTVDDVSVR